ncbi:MAG: hypothetical protein R3174_04515 [Gammaproteobacteria bacterium]|nr:hypothetical protein [Gammaproteobacteria bacterium]
MTRRIGFAAGLLFALGLAAGARPANGDGAEKPVPVAVRIVQLAAGDPVEAEAIEHALAAVGVPYERMVGPESAFEGPLVVLAGSLTEGALAPADRERLHRYVEQGGVLLVTQVQSVRYFPLFGLTEFSNRRNNFEVRFADPGSDPALGYVNRPQERQIKLGDPKLYQEIYSTTEYQLDHAQPLAQFASGGVAFSRNHYGRGVAYCLGLSFTDAVLRPALGQSYEAEREWANVFAPSADVFRLILAAIYESRVRPFVRVHPVPGGLESALLLSHDVDAREAFRYSVDFARLERDFGVASTFFITTKYFTDATDIGYYSGKNIEYVREIRRLGADIGSHSVSHYKHFADLPFGEPDVDFARYRPKEAATVIGEVKVSKELLERDVPGLEVVSFRAGELSHPRQLVRALQVTGYLINSTRAAGNTQTNYAYRPLSETHLGAEVADMVEIPVTLDDSMDYLRPDNVDEVVAAWREIVDANAENHALTGLLIHPTDATYKLEAQRRLLEAYRGKPVWIGDVTRFGRFVRGRLKLRLRAVDRGGRLVLRLNLPRSELPAGVALVTSATPAALTIEDSQGNAVGFRPLMGENGVRRLVLEP